MREIKFRAWDKRNNEMVKDPAFIQVWGYGEAFVFNEDEPEWHTECELMQYTGLLDKNGTEIYEGDIIRFYDRGNMFDNEILPCIARVTMKYAKWFPEPILVKGLRHFEFRGNDIDRGYCGHNEDCEVIGNIYENPELLR